MRQGSRGMVRAPPPPPPQSLSQLDALILQVELGVKELGETPFDNLRNYLLPEDKDFPFVPGEANRAFIIF